MPRQLPWKVGTRETKQPPSRPKASASPVPASTSRSPASSHRPAPASWTEETPKDRPKNPRRSLGLLSTPGTSFAYSPQLVLNEVKANFAQLARHPPRLRLNHQRKSTAFCLRVSTYQALDRKRLILLRFMIEGIDHDDMYRMVEDEFLAVAGEFTRHIHTAEYQRLKGLAKSQNAETIQTISRPVTQEMTDLVKWRHAALDTAARQRRGLAKALRQRGTSNDSDEENLPRRPATSLQGLMDNSPRKQSVPLTSIIGTRPGSSYRRATGVGPSSHQRPGNHTTPFTKPGKHVTAPGSAHQGPSLEPFKHEISTDSDEDDGLDGQPPWPRKQTPQRLEPKNGIAERPPVPQQTSQLSSQSSRLLVANRAQPRGHQSPTNDASTSEQIATPNDDDYDPLARLRARRAEQKRRRMSNKTQDNNKKTSESLAEPAGPVPFA
ncbi:hypothetical protein VTH06DRAFT_2468 [Thermothelomyces fergusii]